MIQGQKIETPPTSWLDQVISAVVGVLIFLIAGLTSCIASFGVFVEYVQWTVLGLFPGQHWVFGDRSQETSLTGWFGNGGVGSGDGGTIVITADQAAALNTWMVTNQPHFLMAFVSLWAMFLVAILWSVQFIDRHVLPFVQRVILHGLADNDGKG